MRRWRTWHRAARATTAEKSSKNFERACGRCYGRRHRMPSGLQGAPQAPNQQLDALELRDCRTPRQDVVILLLDLFEHAHPAAAEQLEIESEPAIHRFHQRQAFEKQLASHVNGIAHDIL